MPTFEIAVAVGSDDVTANQEGTFSATSAFLYVGTISGSTDSYFYVRLLGLAIPRGNKIDSAVLRVKSNGTGTSALAIESRLDVDLTPVIPTTSGFRTRIYTTARGAMVVPSTVVQNDFYDIDFAPALQEMVNKAGWANTGQNIGVVVKLQDPANTLPRRLFASLEASSTSIPKIIVTHSAPLTTVTAEATLKMPTPGLSAQGEIGSGTVSGQATLKMPTLGFSAEAVIGTPPPVVAQATLGMPTPGLRAYGGEADPKKNTPFAVELPNFDSHFLVTEAGELLGFATRFDRTVGGVRDGVSGQSDNAWFAESGLSSRTPGSLSFTAYFADHDEPKLSRDRMARLLPNVRSLILPDGRVFGVDRAQHRGRPQDYSLELSVITTGAEPEHPLLSGTISAAFETKDSTPEIPIYAIDSSGGITAPLEQKQAERGALFFAVRLAERGILPLGSVGRPVEADGSADPTGMVLSYQDRKLVASLRGVETRLREIEFGTFGALLVGLLGYTRHSAYLITRSGLGTFAHELPVGVVQDLSERILTAGVRADGVGLGAFMALGSYSLGSGLAYYSPRVPTRTEAETMVGKLYRQIKGSTWEIIPPEVSLELTRADSKALELAPGESLTLSFTVRRMGDYTGALVVTADVGEGLTKAVARVGVTDTYNVTVSAPAGTAEAPYTLRVDAKAAGADDPDSLFYGVADSFDALVQVAASPVIAPNPTFVLPMQDATQYRMSEFLRDSSGNNNTFSWHGFARPDRAGKGVLSPGAPSFPGITGPLEAAIYSGVLQNPTQPQRMVGGATYCIVNAEVEKTPVGGVMWAFAAEGSEDGAAVLRAQGGFQLRTRLGAAVVTSPDVHSGGGCCSQSGG